MSTASEDQKRHFEDLGYLVVRGAVSERLAESLAAAADIIIENGAERDSEAELRWIDRDRRIPDIISDMLSPLRYAPAFGELFDAVTLPFAESLLNLRLRCSWLSLFVGGAGYPYSTPIHRDNNSVGPEEKELLEVYRMRQCYFQAPLIGEDRFLQVIPGSHLRPSTNSEISAAECDWRGKQLPGMITIELLPGDVVYRHTNMLHRGWNPEGKPRRTLVSGLWSDELPMLDVEKKDYNVLCEPRFLNTLPPALRSSVQRFLDAWEQQAKECQT